MHANVFDSLNQNPVIGAYSELKTDRINLVPKARTVLERLVGMRTPVYAINDFNKTGLRYCSIYNLANDSLGYVSGLELKKDSRATLDEIERDPYTAMIEQTSDIVSASVKRHIGYIKNVVKPKVEEFMTTVYERYSAHKPEQPGSKYKIIQCRLPDLLFNGVFEDMISDYKNNKLSTKFSYDKTVYINEDENTDFISELKSFITIGSDEFDSMALALLEEVIKKDEHILRHYLCGKPENLAQLANMNVYMRSDICVICYLYFKALFEKDLPSFIYGGEDVRDRMSLTILKNWASERRDYFGTLLVLARIEGSLENPLYKNSVVITHGGFNDEVYVNSYVYKKWLLEGGNVETLYGMLVSGKIYFTIDELNAAQPKLLEIWKSHCLFHATFQKNQSFNIFTDVCRAVFLEGLSDPSPEEKEYHSRITTAQEKAISIFNSKVRELSIADMDDPTMAAIKLIAGARFYYTDAEDFLTDMMTFMKISPNSTIDDAVTYATLNYTFNYVIDQIGVG